MKAFLDANDSPLAGLKLFFEISNGRVTVDTPFPSHLNEDEIEALKARLRDCMPLDTLITDLWDWNVHFEDNLEDAWYFEAVFGKPDDIAGCADLLAEYFLEKCDEYDMDYDQDAGPEWFKSHALEQATKFVVGWRRKVVAKYGLTLK